MKPKKKHLRVRFLLIIIGIVLLGVLLTAILFDPVALVSDSVGAARIRIQLPHAREKWDASSPSAYSIHVKGAIPLLCLIDAELIVREGVLAEVRARENPLVADSPLILIQDDSPGTTGCPYDELTVESVFRRAENQLKGAGLLGAPLEIKFDEERGFITSYRYGRASWGGLLGVNQSECCTWFDFDDFKELPH